MDEHTSNATNVMENMIDFIPIGTKKHYHLNFTFSQSLEVGFNLYQLTNY